MGGQAHNPTRGQAHNPARGLAYAVAYAAMSMSLALLNKFLLSSYSFPCFFTLLATQLSLSLAFCVATRDYLGNPFGIARLDAKTARLAAPMAVAYVANVVVGMAGLQATNVPMFFAIRRLVPACIVAYEWATAGKRPDREARVAVSIIAVGAIAAGWETLDANLAGYALTMLNNMITGACWVTRLRGRALFQRRLPCGLPCTQSTVSPSAHRHDSIPPSILCSRHVCHAEALLHRDGAVSFQRGALQQRGASLTGGAARARCVRT